MTAMTSGLRHGHPDVSRNDKWAHDKYVWPDGLELFIYDDGRVKIGRWDASAVRSPTWTRPLSYRTSVMGSS